MSLILITGISTTGKSTVARELVKRGYTAYDTEHNGISAWYDKQTGEKAAEFGQMPERTDDWLDRHEWRISMDWIINIAEKVKNQPVFLCGGAANEQAVRDICQQVFWLKTDEATIRARVGRPRDHDYGTKPHELAAIIAGNKEKEAEYLRYGATMIDATQPLEVVIDTILDKLTT